MKIRKQPGELWSFFSQNVYRLKYDEYVIAERDDVAVTLSSSSEYDPILSVTRDGKLILCYAIDEKMLEDTAQAIYEDYILDKAESPEPQDEQEHEDDTLYEHEDELMMSFKDFMNVVLDGEELVYDASFDGDMAELMDLVLQTVADAGYIVRRPMYITNDDGSETLVEYPYGDDVQ